MHINHQTMPDHGHPILYLPMSPKTTDMLKVIYLSIYVQNFCVDKKVNSNRRFKIPIRSTLIYSTDKLARHFACCTAHTVLHKIRNVFCLCLNSHIGKILPAGLNHDVRLAQEYRRHLQMLLGMLERAIDGAHEASATSYFFTRIFFTFYVYSAWMQLHVNDVHKWPN